MLTRKHCKITSGSNLINQWWPYRIYFITILINSHAKVCKEKSESTNTGICRSKLQRKKKMGDQKLSTKLIRVFLVFHNGNSSVSTTDLLNKASSWLISILDFPSKFIPNNAVDLVQIQPLKQQSCPWHHLYFKKVNLLCSVPIFLLLLNTETITHSSGYI